MRIKVEFWNEKDPEVWGKRYEKLAFVLLIFFIINVMVGILTSQIYLIIINTIPTLMGVLIYISYNKRERGEECKSQKKRPKLIKTVQKSKNQETLEKQEQKE